MADNEFLTFADADDANVMPQADYAALGTRTSGFEAGKAVSLQFNKVWRQCAFVASAVAQLIPDLLNVDAADDGDFATFLANLKAALQATVGASRLIIAAGPQNILVTDRAVFINQTIAAAITLMLPAVPAVNQEVTIYDDKGDADVNNITLNGNGHGINGYAGNLYPMNQKYMAVTLRWNNNGAWRVKCVASS